MFLAELICSDDDCDVAIDAVGSPDELALLVCEHCGCCMQIVSLSGWQPVVLVMRPALARAA
jgi:hypothetical protein